MKFLGVFVVESNFTATRLAQYTLFHFKVCHLKKIITVSQDQIYHNYYHYQ